MSLSTKQAKKIINHQLIGWAKFGNHDNRMCVQNKFQIIISPLAEFKIYYDLVTCEHFLNNFKKSSLGSALKWAWF